MHYPLLDHVSWIRLPKRSGLHLLVTLALTHAGIAADSRETKAPGRFTNASAPPPTVAMLSRSSSAGPHRTERVVDKQLTGRVIGDNGEGIPGVNVQIKGTTRGTTTDANGTYRLTIPDDAGTVLVFSYIGYATQEVTVGNRSAITVTLATDDKTLNEVVVVGYGTQRKRDITGAVATVTETTLKEVPSPNLVNQLKGRAAGVSIVSNGATPGSQGQIRIRGNRTLTTTQNGADALDGPLVVVDGIPYSGLNDINPDDIANIEILKDASATAIYGSRGSGGVLLVTTKRGKTGKPVISYDGYQSTTSIMNEYPVYNGAEYAQFKADAATYNRTAPGTTAYGLTQAEKDALAAGVSTDWQKLIYRKGYTTNHQLSLQGGTETTQYGMNAGFFQEQGIIPKQNFSRFTIRATIDQKIGSRIRVGLNTLNTLTYTNTPGGAGVPSNLVRITPLASPYNADGTVNLMPAVGSLDAPNYISPLTLITKSDAILGRGRNLRTFNSLYAEVNIVNGLRYRFNAGLNYSQGNYNGYSGPLTYVNTATVQSSSSANLSNTETWNYDLQHLLYYDKTIAQKHKIGFTGLFEVVKDHAVNSAFSVTGVPADYILSSNFGLASGTPVADPTQQYFTEQGLISYMGRVNYSYADKYLLTLTFRRDGSSTLSPGNQYFNYPAVGLGWNIAEEGFMKSITAVTNLKLRGGYGISGNRNVSPYATLGALTAGYYNFGQGTAGQQLAYTVTSLPATTLGWQSTGQLDVGVDFGFFSNRLTGSVDYYHQKTKDILLSVPLPASNGASSTLKNLGRTEGQGMEISLTGDIIRNPKGFNWSADVVYFFNREKITQLTTPTEQANVAAGWFVGQPLSVIYDYKKIGIWQNADKENGTLAKQTSPVQQPGQIRVEDLNGDGKIDPNDRQIIGNFQPKWEGGLTNRFSFKGFDLSIVTFARMGMKVVVPYLTGNAGGAGGFPFFNQGRVNQIKTDYWTDTNPTNAFPAPDANNSVLYYASTLGYYDGSFIKVRSINFGYTFATQLIRKIGFNSARVYLNATNPFILYSPLVRDHLAVDPEGNGYAGTAGSNGGTVVTTAGDTGAPARQVVVNLNNPPVRQFTLGVNLKF